MIELFRSKDGFKYFMNLREKIKNDIRSLPDQDIINKDVDELNKHYFEKHYINPMITLEKHMSKTMT